MFKRNKKLILMAVLALSLGLTACAPAEDADAPETEEDASQAPVEDVVGEDKELSEEQRELLDTHYDDLDEESEKEIYELKDNKDEYVPKDKSFIDRSVIRIEDEEFQEVQKEREAEREERKEERESEENETEETDTEETDEDEDDE